MRRLFLVYKPSGSPFLRSDQERVLQSLLCSVKSCVRSYRRILSAAAVSPCQMGVQLSRCNAKGSYTKKIGRVSTFSAKNRKNFIYHDTPQRKASEKRQKARQPFRLNGYRAMIDYVNYYCTFCSMRYSDARDWMRSAVVFSSIAPSRYAVISSSMICSMGSVG